MPKCITNTVHDSSYLKEIDRFYRNDIDDEEHVIRWCEECGAIVVDIEHDNRLIGHEMDLRFPSYLKDKI